MPSLSHILSLSLLRYRENLALNFEGMNFTYIELTKRVAYFQKVFRYNPQITYSIGIIANHDFDTYSAILSALISGITYVPIEPSHPDERNNHIIRLSKVKAIFCSDLTSLNRDFYEKNKSMFFETVSETAVPEDLKVVESDNPAYILFTSGSTGVPKGVPISQQNLAAFSENVAKMKLEINENSRFLQVFELTFDLSVFSFLLPLLHGASVFTLPKTPFKQMAAVQIIQDHNITHILTVPSFVSFLKPLFAKIKLASVTNWLFCGEALKSDLVTAWHKCLTKANIYNVYGPTEATIFCTSYLCSRDNLKHHNGITCIGKPFEGTGFGLFDEDLPVDTLESTDELCISGSQLTTGYLDDSVKNKQAFFTHEMQTYYRSGDLCRKDNEGDYFFIGRNDTQVKINGYRVEISELEFHAAKFAGVDESVVIVSENEKSDQPILNLVYTAKDKKDKDDFFAFLAAKIPIYMLPTDIFHVESIPYNLNGKIDKRVLAEIIGARSKM